MQQDTDPLTRTAGRRGGAGLSRAGRILSPPRPAGPHVVRRLFQGILGKRRTMENLPVLVQAQSAYMGLKRSAKAIRGRGANIFTQWVGDPDALGSAVVLSAILRELGAEEVRILTGSLGHPQNRNLVARCGIVLHDPNRDRLRGGLHCMVDTSPPLGILATPGVDPVKDYFFVADHHADPEEVEANCRAKGVRRVRLPFVGLAVGSTSAFMAVIAAAFDVLDKLTPAAEGRGRARHLHRHERAPPRGDASRLQDVRGAHAVGGDAGDPRRAARLPRAPGVVRLPRLRLPQPGGHGRRPRGPRRVRPRRAPGRDRRDRQRAAARRGHLDRDHDRGDGARGRGVGARRQPPAGTGPGGTAPAPDRARHRLPAGLGLSRPLGLPARAAAAAPRGGRRLRAADPRSAHGVAPRQRRRTRGGQRPHPGLLPGARAAAGGGPAGDGDPQAGGDAGAARGGGRGGGGRAPQREARREREAREREAGENGKHENGKESDRGKKKE